MDAKVKKYRLPLRSATPKSKMDFVRYYSNGPEVDRRQLFVKKNCYYVIEPFEAEREDYSNAWRITKNHQNIKSVSVASLCQDIEGQKGSCFSKVVIEACSRFGKLFFSINDHRLSREGVLTEKKITIASE